MIFVGVKFMQSRHENSKNFRYDERELAQNRFQYQRYIVFYEQLQLFLVFRPFFVF